MKHSHLFSVLIAAIIFLYNPFSAHAQLQPDLRLGAYTNGSFFFIGGGFAMPIGNNFAINPTANYAFKKNNGVFFVDLDLHYHITAVNAIDFYVGPGLNLGIDGSEFFTGVNVIAGIGFKGFIFEPYIQPTLVIGKSSVLKLTAGIRF